MLKKRGLSIVQYVMINGWMFLLLIIVLVVMNQIGFFDSIINPQPKCVLGDGFTCLLVASYIDDNNESDGSVNDTVTILFRNELSDNMYGLKINASGCEGEHRGKANDTEVVPGETAEYIVYKCKGINPKRMFDSSLVIYYETMFEGKFISHLAKGYITSYVGYPDMDETFSDKFEQDKNAIKNFFRRHIG